MRHFSDHEAALASSGDLPFLLKLQSQAHCLICPSCRARVEAFRSDRSRVDLAVDAFELPRAIKWDQLEAEMLGNIRLGLDVDAIHQGSSPKTEERFIPWRAAVAIAAMTVIVMTGWFLTGPGSRPAISAVAQVRSGGMLLRGDENGVGVENRGSGMILRNVAARSNRIEVGLEGSVRSSVVDQDSGQVTVSQIYVE
ncbi:MAG: hypothetical protein NTW74_18835 [Acidobacteria bacterium]|nr:hypothetical protein [Acidobacteriota bacterium]